MTDIERVSKVDAARRHLDQAIRLFLEDRDPLVVHTVAAAAQGVLRDIAKATGQEHLSILHDHAHIPPEERKAWINVLNAPRNFLKHADNDPHATLEFDVADNEKVLLDAVLLFGSVTNEYLSSASVYIGWITTKHPRLRTAISNNQIGDFCVRNGILPDEKSRFLELIDSKILVDPIKR